MLSFPFVTNYSFARYPSHPITVPRSRVDYPELRSLGLDHGSLSILCPDGEVLLGSMYGNKAGFGPYYQIRMRGRRGDALSLIPLGTRLVVELERSGADRMVRLVRRRDSSDR